MIQIDNNMRHFDNIHSEFSSFSQPLSSYSKFTINEKGETGKR